MISQKAGKNPRNSVQKLDSDHNTSVKSSQSKSNTESENEVFEEVEQNSREQQSPLVIRPPTIDNCPSTDIDERKVSIGSSASRCSLTSRTAKPRRPPPKPGKSQEVIMTNDGIKCKTSDEGYNSSSYSSGEKSQDDGPNHKEVVPLMREGRASILSHCSSIQDEAGYEIPMVSPSPIVSPRVSVSPSRSSVGGVEATDQNAEVALKFLFKKKNLSFNDKEGNRASARLSCPPSSPDSRLASIDERWTPTHTYTGLHESKSTKNMDRFCIPIYFITSLCLSVGFYLLLYFLTKVSMLLIFSITVIIFTMLFVGLLTFGYRCILSIMVLLGPSLFTKKTKICLCITIAVLIIAGPICNISRNITVAIYQNKSQLPLTYIRNTSFEKYHLRTMSPSTINTKQIMLTQSQTSNQSNQKDNPTKSLLQLCIHKFQIIQSACKETLKDYCQSSRESQLCMSVKELCPSSSAIAYACTYVAAIKINNSKSDITIIAENIRIIATIKVILLELLPLLFVFFLCDAYIYHRDYLSNKEMDNIYITGKLKVLDCEKGTCSLQEKLFPLRKLEFRKYILPSSFRLTAEEMKTVVKWIILWIIVGFIILFSLLLDYYVLEALQILKGRISREDQQYIMQFTQIDIDLKNSMFIVFSLLFVAIGLQSYMLRARSRICAFFYPKRESIRAMFLYYQILHDRSQFWKFCRERIQHHAEVRKSRWRIGVAHRIFAVMPKPMDKLVKKCFVYRCMICNSFSWRKSFICYNNDCCATFCFECYIDMGENCISCINNPSAEQAVYYSCA